MSIIVLADNVIGLEAIKFLKSKNEKIEAIFLHPKDYCNLDQEIIAASELEESRIFNIGKNWDEESLTFLQEVNPDFILAASWRYILPKEVIKIAKKTCINFHLSFLPFNKGKKPNVWPIIEGTPAGVSLHEIDENIDTGPVIARKEVIVEPIDTGRTLYIKLVKTMNQLFKNEWENIKKGNYKLIDQRGLEGTFHLDKDFAELDLINLDKHYLGRDLINLLRARTFKPYPAAYFMENGRKVYVRVELEYKK